MINKRGSETRQKIKEKAYGLFASKGFKEVTMKDICEAAGLSRGGLYCHYESTSQIFKELLDDLLGLQEDEFEKLIEQKLPAPVILDTVLQRYEGEMLDGEASLSIAIFEYFSMKNLSLENNLLYEQYLMSSRSWKKLIQYGIERHEFKNVDSSAVFDLIVFSYQGVRMYSKLMPVDREIPKRILNEIRKILIGGEE